MLHPPDVLTSQLFFTDSWIWVTNEPKSWSSWQAYSFGVSCWDEQWFLLGSYLFIYHLKSRLRNSQVLVHHRPLASHLCLVSPQRNYTFTGSIEVDPNQWSRWGWKHLRISSIFISIHTKNEYILTISWISWNSTSDFFVPFNHTKYIQIPKKLPNPIAPFLSFRKNLEALRIEGIQGTEGEAEGQILRSFVSAAEFQGSKKKNYPPGN